MTFLPHNLLISCALFAYITYITAQQVFYPGLTVKPIPVLANGQLRLVVNSLELAAPLRATRDAQGRPLQVQQSVGGQQIRSPKFLPNAQQNNPQLANRWPMNEPPIFRGQRFDVQPNYW